MKNIIYAFMFFVSFSIIGTASSQQLDKEKAKALVESKNFVFKVQTVVATGAPTNQMNSGYDLKVLGDSIVTYLPYFGRAYSAPDYGQPGGINFTSTEFEYRVKAKKKGGWDITIKPGDTRDVRQLFLNISESGYASLQVISNNRQPISFYGYVEAR